MKTLKFFAAITITILFCTFALNTAFAQRVPDLVFTLSPQSPPAGQIAMGSTGNALWLLYATNNTKKTIGIGDMHSFQNVKSGQQPDITNVSVYVNDTLMGVASAPIKSVGPGNGFLYNCTMSQPILIPMLSTIAIRLTADVDAWQPGLVTDGTRTSFELRATQDIGNQLPDEVVEAYNSDGERVRRISFRKSKSAEQTILRSILELSAQPLGETVNRIPLPWDQFAGLILTANPAGAISPRVIGITFSGTAPNKDFLKHVKMIGPDGQDITISLGANVYHTKPCDGTNQCRITWTFFPDTFALAEGTSYQMTLTIDDDYFNFYLGQELTLMATIQKGGDVKYLDAPDASAQVGMPDDFFLLLNSVSFAP